MNKKELATLKNIQKAIDSFSSNGDAGSLINAKNMLDLLMIEGATASVPKTNKINMTAIYNRLDKLNKKNYNFDNRFNCKYIYNNFNCLIGGGYYVLMTPDPMDKETGSGFDIRPVIDSIINNNIDIVLDLVDIKAYKKISKDPYIIQVIKGSQEFFLAFNTQYMIDCLNYCGVSSIKINLNDIKNKVYHAPLYIKGAKNEAILMPINIYKHYTEGDPVNAIIEL